jgi:hypothetical protein
MNFLSSVMDGIIEIWNSSPFYPIYFIIMLVIGILFEIGRRRGNAWCLKQWPLDPPKIPKQHVPKEVRIQQIKSGIGFTFAAICFLAFMALGWAVPPFTPLFFMGVFWVITAIVAINLLYRALPWQENYALFSAYVFASAEYYVARHVVLIIPRIDDLFSKGEIFYGLFFCFLFFVLGFLLFAAIFVFSGFNILIANYNANGRFSYK